MNKILLPVLISLCSFVYSQTAEDYYNRGKAKAKLEDYVGAIQDYSKAIELEPEDEKGYYGRGIAKANLEDYRGAVQDYNKAIKLAPERPELYFFRGLSKGGLEDHRGTIQDFNKAIKLDPENRSPYFYRAKMYHKQEEYEKEKADYLKTIEMDSKDPEGYYYLALLYVSHNQNFQAISYFEKAITKLSADLGYYITAENGKERIELEDIYIKRAEIYKNAEATELMCEEYKKACDLGDCEMFNQNCK